VVTPAGGQITIGALNNNAIWNANRLQGTAINPGLAPNAGDVLAWDGTNNWWTAAPLSSLISVATQSPIVGDGSAGDPIRFADGDPLLRPGVEVERERMGAAGPLQRLHGLERRQ
jgi:hypothetical protein